MNINILFILTFSVKNSELFLKPEWIIDLKSMKNKCRSKIHLAGEKNIESKALVVVIRFFVDKTQRSWWMVLSSSCLSN